MKNLIIDTLILLTLVIITTFIVLACVNKAINKDDVILKSDEKTITVVQYKNQLNWDKENKQTYITKDSVIVEFKQKKTLSEGKVIYATHNSDDDSEKHHYIIIKDKNKNKNVASPGGLSDQIIRWCRHNYGEEIKLVKEYYPEERYIIITKDNEIID